MAYQVAARLEQDLGSKELSQNYLTSASRLKETIRRKYWDMGRGLFADNTDSDNFSQHANTLAILTECSTGKEASSIAKKLIDDTDLAPASIYFKYYLHQAMVKAGLGDRFLNQLDIWKENIDLGLTTWAETSDVKGSRSDCHAWGSSPNIEFFRTVLGINSGGPGFSKVWVQPHLGTLTEFGGAMPHPSGTISTQYKLINNLWSIAIDLPENTPGTLIWKGQEHHLNPGNNTFSLK